MSLYLGRVGRKILNYTTSSQRLNHAVDVFGKIAHRVTFGQYTPGLTRESFLLFNRIRPGDIVDVKNDGFYSGGEKIAGNTYVSQRIKNSEIPTSFQCVGGETPEDFAAYCRLSYKTPLSFLSEMKKIINYQFSDLEKYFMEEEAYIVARNLINPTESQQSIPSPNFREATLANFPKYPLFFATTLSTSSMFFISIALGTSSSLEIIGGALALLNIYMISFFSTLWGASYSSGKGLNGIFFGKQAIIVSPIRDRNSRTQIVAHEMVHHLRFNGLIEDDSIAETVATVRAKERGIPLTNDSVEHFEKTSIKLHNGKLDVVLEKSEHLADFYRKTHIGEGFSGAYEYGQTMGAIAWWIYQNTGDSSKMWLFIRLLGQKYIPREAYFLATRNSMQV